jgi:hypothetical protein
MTPENLGWRPYVDTWIEKKFGDDEILTDPLRNLLFGLFD